MPMNKRVFKRRNRWMASFPALLMVLIICFPAQAQRGGGRGGGGGRGQNQGGGGPGQFPGGGGPSLPLPEPLMLSQPAVPKNVASILDMRVMGGNVTADIVNCPLQSALQELADRTGIIFEFRSHDTPLVSVHLNNIPMEEAIQRIASSHNAVFAYDQQDNHIKTVRVFPRTAAIQQPSLIYLGSGTITKTNDDVNTPEQAIRALAENARLEMKEKAVNILVHNKSEEATKALMSSLIDPAPEIRVAAIDGLVTFQKHDALPEIIKCLKDADPKVRLSAATAVALLGSYKNIPDLKPLSADKDVSVASEADKAILKWSGVVRK
jgi:hypothetical protein